MKQVYENQVNNQVNGNGKLNNDDVSVTTNGLDEETKKDGAHDEEVKNELFKLRQRMCLGNLFKYI